MAFVPGYKHDVFVSYAHGDNREWITRFVGRLESELRNKLGDSADVWLDDSDLRLAAYGSDTCVSGRCPGESGIGATGTRQRCIHAGHLRARIAPHAG